MALRLPLWSMAVIPVAGPHWGEALAIFRISYTKISRFIQSL